MYYKGELFMLFCLIKRYMMFIRPYTLTILIFINGLRSQISPLKIAFSLLNILCFLSTIYILKVILREKARRQWRGWCYKLGEMSMHSICLWWIPHTLKKMPFSLETTLEKVIIIINNINFQILDTNVFEKCYLILEEYFCMLQVSDWRKTPL